MDGQAILRWLLPVAGALLIGLVLLDVFLTVLYARAGSGIISHHLACHVWRLFRWVARRLPRYQDAILCICGPIIIVLGIFVWVLGLACGAALVIKPALGTSVRATNGGPTPTDFFTALYVGGDSMTTVGTSDLAPQTPFYRLFFTFTSFVGISVITLTLAYILEIYNALQRRNTFALKVHFAAGESADAAELVAGVGPAGQFNAGYTHLAEMSAEMVNFKESHHFYSVLLYFRFREPQYALSRLALTTLDAVTLIKSALDDREYGWVKESAAVAQLWRGSMHLMTLLAATFLPGGLPEPQEPDAATADRWRRRYRAALDRLRQAEIATAADEEAGADNYVALRARWDRYISLFAHHMGHAVELIDPVGCDPAHVAQRQEFRARLRSAG